MGSTEKKRIAQCLRYAHTSGLSGRERLGKEGLRRLKRGEKGKKWGRVIKSYHSLILGLGCAAGIRASSQNYLAADALGYS